MFGVFTFRRRIWHNAAMLAALLPDRGVVKVDGPDARKFLNGLITSDMAKVAWGHAAFAALLTPQGKIIADFIVAEAEAAEGSGFFLDCPRALVPTLVERFNFFKLRAKVLIEDLSETLAVMAIWDGSAAWDYGLLYGDPRLPDLGARMMLSPHLAPAATKDLGAKLVDAIEYEAHRIALAIPRGGMDFVYGDAFPHETDMDQLNGVDFEKGCFVGQEVVSRIENRGTARNRLLGVRYDEFAPEAGIPVQANEKPVGTVGSASRGRGLAMLRLDRVAEALAKGEQLTAGGIALEVVKPPWARFELPRADRAAE